MWIRKRLDISAKDLGYALVSCFSFGSEKVITKKIRNVWERDNQKCLVCLSVRSGFDLLLEALNFEPGSEILMSALTIPDMPKIVSHHQLVPIGIDLSADKLLPTAKIVEAAITGKTKAIVIAHLFGGISDLEEIAQVARKHGILLIEDCAQAYYSPSYSGDQLSDISMFSFGTIKTATALGGGILIFRNKDLLFDEIAKINTSYPVQKRLKFLSKTIKYFILDLVSKPEIFPLFIKLVQKREIDYDSYIHKLSRSFPHGQLIFEIRKKPSIPLLKLMLRRFRNYDFSIIDQRIIRGQLLEELLPESVFFTGHKAETKSYWAFAVKCSQPELLVSKLYEAGFDATHRSSLIVVESEQKAGFNEAKTAAEILAQIVYLPLYPEMPLTEFYRLADCLNETKNNMIPIR